VDRARRRRGAGDRGRLQALRAAPGGVAGGVSGGCVEGAVVEAAAEVLGGGRPRLLHFGIADEQAWDVGLPCGGEIDVWLERYEP
jgi:xanthine dehydrogenase accessory factor